MVFKGRFFSSKKSSESSSSPDGSNSPNTPTRDSPNRSDKNKVKSSPSSSSSPASSFRHSLQQLHQSTKSKTDLKAKDIKGKDSASASASASTPPASPATAPAKLRKGAAAAAAADGSLSPILASSLGLNRIKTRSGPLPQETPGHRMSGLGSSNLGRGQGSEICSTSSSSAAGKSSGKKKDARGLQKVPVPESYPSSWGDHGGSGDSKLRNQIGNADLTSGQLGMATLMIA